MALYYPDRRTLASYCADHGKTPSSVESLLINVPFSLITPQLVEAAGCASFPSCSYEDSLSALITRSVKVSERPRATCKPRSFEVTNNENKEQTSFSWWVINRIRMSRGHESKVMRPDCVRKDLYTFSNLHWTIKICSRVSLSHCVCASYQKIIILFRSVVSKVFSSTPLITHTVSALIPLPTENDNMQ